MTAVGKNSNVRKATRKLSFLILKPFIHQNYSPTRAQLHIPSERVKGTVSQDFLIFFFHQTTSGPIRLAWKRLLILSNIRICSRFPVEFINGESRLPWDEYTRVSTKTKLTKKLTLQCYHHCGVILDTRSHFTDF
jgi:hypothetical protein